jgi:hypothetical protein
VASGLQTIVPEPRTRCQWVLGAAACSATYDLHLAIYSLQRAIYKKIINSAKKTLVNFV